MFAQCTNGTICFELVKGIPSAIVALTVAIAGGYITWQQYRVARAKLNLDLFERRYAVFEIVWGYLSRTLQGGPDGPFTGKSAELTNIIPQTEFLFGAEMAGYLRSIHTMALELWTIDQRTKARGDVMDQADIKRHLDVANWLNVQASTGAKAEFGKYLDFSRWD
ncbi:hypothetical protein P3T32_002037 [Ralstonia sp. GP73]|uniref:hypothetical protein n=1 Tax=unclassified Ralstonia TaxID=209769 RepID=UPI00247663ED|nr:hypothetical protein [Ralstonia sp. GP73]MDH6642195.1 hypothetical protein [Ralstonia sp. GP73]